MLNMSALLLNEALSPATSDQQNATLRCFIWHKVV